ncbi:MAG: formylglycine-generating enzyme family protein [Candidatus Hydrogenedentes bacterium]|nr:formylglycine-generating enzyme family protein [Candidatus Hydrogenedentota bacterium]
MKTMRVYLTLSLLVAMLLLGAGCRTLGRPNTNGALRLGATGGSSEITILLPGNVPLELVRIPAGASNMGSTYPEQCWCSNELPEHRVEIEYGFYMGKYEVTQSQWVALMGDNPSHFLGANRPVENVSWREAQLFINALNGHIAATGQGPATMRLPSEAEWEYACRARTGTRFYFGDSLGAGDTFEDYATGDMPGKRSDYMWYLGNISDGTKPVGGKLPNAFGLYDMHGNVWEWCEDVWHGNYSGAPTDGSVWVHPPGLSDYVCRGGGWINYAWDCRSARRTCHNSGHQDFVTGFRLAATR